MAAQLLGVTRVEPARRALGRLGAAVRRQQPTGPGPAGATPAGLTPFALMLIRLKLRLLANLFRRSPWQIVGIVIGLMYGAGFTVAAVATLIGLRIAPVSVATPIVVIGGSIAVVGFLILPVLLGVDDTMDARRFALFGIERTRLAFALAAAALVGIPSVVLALVSLATVVTWSRSIGAFLVALLAAPIIVATCTLLTRISAAGAGMLLSTRRSREATTAIGIVVIVLLSPALVLLTSIRDVRGFERAAQTASGVLGVTPLGAAWAAPATIAAGNAFGLVQLLIAAVTLGLLWLAWRALVRVTLVTPSRQGRVQSFQGLGWFGRLPARPGWAVAARSLTYWGRDVRYRMSLVMIPVTPVLIIVPLLIAGVPARPLALIPIPIVALFLGWLGHNDVAYDSTAVWLHVAAGVRGQADRLGRAVPVLAIGVPVVVVGSIVCARIYGDGDMVYPLLGVSICLLFSGIGFSFVSSARFPYPVPKPGTSPFQQPNATNGATVAVQSLTFFLEFVVAAPALLLAGLAVLYGGGWYGASFGVGVGIAAVVFFGGLAWGGRVFSKRGPEILAAALRI